MNLPQGVQLQVVLRTGQIVFVSPPEQFNFTTFVLDCESKGYLLLANMIYISMDVVAFMSMGEVNVGMVPQVQGMMQ